MQQQIMGCSRGCSKESHFYLAPKCHKANSKINFFFEREIQVGQHLGDEQDFWGFDFLRVGAQRSGL